MSLVRGRRRLGAWTVSAAQIVAVASIAALAAINYVGVRSGNRVNVVLTVAKVAGLAALPILALIVADASPEWTPIVPPVPRPLAAFGIAMIAVLWANDAGTASLGSPERCAIRSATCRARCSSASRC